MRRSVRRMSGCLGALPATERRYLSLRAGLAGPPLSAGQAARDLGVSHGAGLGIERRGMRDLRSAAASGCGSPAGGATSPAGGGSAPGSFVRSVLSQAAGMPRLQPAMALAADVNPLVDPAKLRGREQMGGIVPSSSPSDDGWADPAPLATVTRPARADAPGSPAPLWIILSGVLALMGITTLVAMRRRPDPAPAEPMFVPAQRLELPDLPAVPLEVRRPNPVPQAAPAHAPRDQRRKAAMVASGVASLAVRELVRRRRRR